MIVVDLNLLIYAVNSDSALHKPAAKWLNRSLSGTETVGLAWVVILGFLRITTHPRIFPKPLSADQAMAIAEEWMKHPLTQMIEPQADHFAIIKELLAPLGLAGNLTTDAHLAALTIEHAARLYSADNDFSRFHGLRWVNPLS